MTTNLLPPWDDDDAPPFLRGECLPGPMGWNAERPCFFASCRFHLDGAKESCALDVADAGPHTLEEVGVLTNLTRERVRQIEVAALAKVRAVARRLGLEGVRFEGADAPPSLWETGPEGPSEPVKRGSSKGGFLQLLTDKMRQIGVPGMLSTAEARRRAMGGKADPNAPRAKAWGGWGRSPGRPKGSKNRPKENRMHNKNIPVTRGPVYGVPPPLPKSPPGRAVRSEADVREAAAEAAESILAVGEGLEPDPSKAPDPPKAPETEPDWALLTEGQRVVATAYRAMCLEVDGQPKVADLVSRLGLPERRVGQVATSLRLLGRRGYIAYTPRSWGSAPKTPKGTSKTAPALDVPSLRAHVAALDAEEKELTRVLEAKRAECAKWGQILALLEEG